MKLANVGRFVAYVVLLVLAMQLLQGLALKFLIPALHIPAELLQSLEPRTLALSEVFLLIAVVCVTFVMAATERRSIWSYGFTLTPDALKRWCEGALYGVAGVAIVAALMYAFGGFRISGFALHGVDWIVYPLLWLLTMLLIGFTEEAMFRGYPLVALSRAAGFWPAAIVTTLLFGAAHLAKPGENAIDIASVMFIGLFLCFTFWKTGSLWLAAGFHFAFDYMQFFVVGTPNGGQEPMGHLFTVSFPGPAWVNGGPLGTEASCFVFPVILALFYVVHMRAQGAPSAQPATLPT